MPDELPFGIGPPSSGKGGDASDGRFRTGAAELIATDGRGVAADGAIGTSGCVGATLIVGTTDRGSSALATLRT